MNLSSPACVARHVKVALTKCNYFCVIVLDCRWYMAVVRKQILTLLLMSVVVTLALSTLSAGQEKLEEAAAFRKIALELYKQGKYKDSIPVLQKSILYRGGFITSGHDPDWREVVYKLGTAYSIIGDHEHALYVFSGIIINQKGDDATKIITLDTENPQAHYDLGV